MAYNHPYNPDELPRFAEPEQKGGNKAPEPRRPSPAQNIRHSPSPQQQNFRPQQYAQPHPQQHSPQAPQGQWRNDLPSPRLQDPHYRQDGRPLSPAAPPRDHYYNDRPGLPSGPRSGGSVPLPRSPAPPRSPASQHGAQPPMAPQPTFQGSQNMTEDQLRRLFQDLDKNAFGFITEAQLAEALVNGDATKFDPVTVNMMVRMFDSNRNGELEFPEFVGLWRFLEKWCDIFNKFDVDHSGTISLDEFKAALVSFQYRLSESFSEFIFHLYDHGRKGVITFDIFMQSCITLKRMTDIFKRYDDDRDGFITINFEDFVTEFLRQLQRMTAPSSEKRGAP